MIANLLILFEAPALGLQLLIDGILIGAVFALAAYGMALVWGVTNIINVCQGEFVMLGGLVTVLCAEQGVPPLLAVPIAAAALYALGWILFRTVIVHLLGRDMFNSVLATFGIAIVMQQLMALSFGGADRIAESGLGSWFFFDGLVGIAKVKLIVFAACIALGVALALFLARSRQGQAIRATAQEPARGRGARHRDAQGLRPDLCAQRRDLRRGRRVSPRWPTPSTPIAGCPTRSAPS